MVMIPGRSLDGGPDLQTRIEQTESQRAYQRANEWLSAKERGELTTEQIRERLSKLAPNSQELTRRALNEINRRKRGQ